MASETLRVEHPHLPNHNHHYPHPQLYSWFDSDSCEPTPSMPYPMQSQTGVIYPYTSITSGPGFFNTYAFPLVNSMSQLRPKRRQVKMACTNCAAACKRCDEARPCPRCIKYGISDTCVDGRRKERKKGVKRGPYKRKNKPSADPTPSPANSGCTKADDGINYSLETTPASTATSGAPATAETIPMVPGALGYYPYYYASGLQYLPASGTEHSQEGHTQPSVLSYSPYAHFSPGSAAPACSQQPSIHISAKSEEALVEE